MRNELRSRLIVMVIAIGQSVSAHADSTGPELAAYYDNHMAVCDGQAFGWSGDDAPHALMQGVRQVGVGKSNRYALGNDGVLYGWEGDASEPIRIADAVTSFHAGRSGLFAIRNDRSLLHIPTRQFLGFGEEIGHERILISRGVSSAAVGDSANYYVTMSGDLFVTGLAHRGQYGDGRLEAAQGFVKTADKVRQVSSHTGHALILKRDGSVLGTGGNIYGPLGEHGYGDKAVSWGRIFSGARAIATGSAHSLAIDAHGQLWIWGRNEGLTPKRVLDGVIAAAGGNRSSVAIARGNLWQWETGSSPTRKMPCP